MNELWIVQELYDHDALWNACFLYCFPALILWIFQENFNWAAPLVHYIQWDFFRAAVPE